MAETSTVLIVEDQEDVADTYAGVLSEEYAVRTTYSGKEALEALDGEVDVVLLDRRMPSMSGDEVLEKIRDRGVDSRVVMVTAVKPDVDVLTMAFDEYLVKPVQAGQLHDVVEQMLVRKQQDEQIQEMFATASKLATLETKMGLTDLQESEEYAELREEFEQMRKDLTLPESDDPYLEATIEKIEALLQEQQ